MAQIEVRLSDKDREELGGPEWVPLDVDRLLDTPASMLERWESECNHSVERALAECAVSHPPARAVRVLVWLARKQGGANVDAVDDSGMPESFARLAGIRTMHVRIRDKADSPPLEPEQSKPEP